MMIGSVIRDVVYDYDIQNAEGFNIFPLATITNELRWLVQCGGAREIVEIWQSRIIVIPQHKIHKFIKGALQERVDRMWSRWEAL